MSDPNFEHIGTLEDKLIEELSELIQAICKAKRFGIDNFHPVTFVTNRRQILDEMKDVEQRIAAYKKEIEAVKG